MKKTKTANLTRAKAAKARSRSSKLRQRAPEPKVEEPFDRIEVGRRIDQIREEVEFHKRCAAEVKAKLQKLTGTALSELLKVLELKSHIVTLKEDGERGSAVEVSAASGTGAARVPAAAAKELWKRELDQELEKLLIIKRLLEASLPAEAEKKKPLTAPPASNGEKKILVVDDDLTTVNIISHFLRKENYQVSTSLTGVDGLKKAFKDAPDLILLDVMMPDLNGFQFLSIYRENEEHVRTPVIIISSLTEEADVVKGLEIGAVDYITKPCSPQVLIAKIKKNLSSGH